jgi:hypothetical protein
MASVPLNRSTGSSRTPNDADGAVRQLYAGLQETLLCLLPFSWTENKPPVFVFSELSALITCGITQFVVPEANCTCLPGGILLRFDSGAWGRVESEVLYGPTSPGEGYRADRFNTPRLEMRIEAADSIGRNIL